MDYQAVAIDAQRPGIAVICKIAILDFPTSKVRIATMIYNLCAHIEGFLPFPMRRQEMNQPIHKMKKARVCLGIGAGTALGVVVQNKSKEGDSRVLKEIQQLEQQKKGWNENSVIDCLSEGGARTIFKTVRLASSSVLNPETIQLRI